MGMLALALITFVFGFFGLLLLFATWIEGTKTQVIILFALIVLSWGVFIAAINNISDKRTAMDNLKDKCCLEINDMNWNVSNSTLTIDIDGHPFTFKVSDFEGKARKSDGKEILYTSATMSNCFEQNR